MWRSEACGRWGSAGGEGDKRKNGGGQSLHRNNLIICIQRTILVIGCTFEVMMMMSLDPDDGDAGRRL